MRKIALLILSLLVLLAACGAPQTEAPLAATEEKPAVSQPANNQPAKPEAPTIRLALIPVIDTLPMFVAEAEGIYANYGINVEIIPVASAPERDQLLASGQADGTLNEILSVMFFNRDSVQMQVVRYGHMAAPGFGHFFILASENSGISTPADLAGVEIGISQGTIIEYVTDRLLEKNGLSADQIQTVSVPRIPDRMALLGSGELKAAVMPDPLAALAVQQGASIVLDDTRHPLYGASVISFRKEFIDENPAAVRSFLRAIEDAVFVINLQPGAYSGLLAEKQIVPPALLDEYVIPPFPSMGVPSEIEWAEALLWAKNKGLLDSDPSYQESVIDRFLPTIIIQ
jgi:NitT/TauT family transport system substrate-binding protein